MLVAAIFIGSIVLFGQPSADVEPSEAPSAQNVIMRDGVQYITIAARGGYSPRSTVAQAGVPTVLSVQTDGTYDCSLALAIRSIGYQNMLEPTGEELIDLGSPQPGKLQGVCSMGMYNFAVTFK